MKRFILLPAMRVEIDYSDPRYCHWRCWYGKENRCELLREYRIFSLTHNFSAQQVTRQFDRKNQRWRRTYYCQTHEVVRH